MLLNKSSTSGRLEIALVYGKKALAASHKSRSRGVQTYMGVLAASSQLGVPAPAAKGLLEGSRTVMALTASLRTPCIRASRSASSSLSSCLCLWHCGHSMSDMRSTLP